MIKIPVIYIPLFNYLGENKTIVFGLVRTGLV